MRAPRRSRTGSVGPVCGFLLILTVLWIGWAGCAPMPPAPPHPLGDTAPTQFNTDSYNYDLNHRSNFLYGQMWYFNFVNEVNDIAGVVSFGLAQGDNPLFADQANYSNAMAMVIPNPSVREPFRVWSEHFPLSVPGNFYGSPTFSEGPGVYELQNPAGFIDVLDPADPEGDFLADTYRTAGSVSENGKTISWDLKYERLGAPGWVPWENWPWPYVLGLFGPSWMTYHMHMSSARVNGTFVTDDGQERVEYDIVDAKGYHDGFYGECLFTDIWWNWLDYKQWDESGNLDLSVVLHKPSGPLYECQGGWTECTPGNLRVYSGGEVYDFYRPEIEIQFFGWTLDPEFHAEHPTEEIITAENDTHYLCLHWVGLPGRMEKALWDLPWPLQDNVTFEFISQFEGAFYQKTPGGDCSSCDGNCAQPCPSCGTLLKEINGIGWSDYVGRPLPPQ